MNLPLLFTTNVILLVHFSFIRTFTLLWREQRNNANIYCFWLHQACMYSTCSKSVNLLTYIHLSLIPWLHVGACIHKTCAEWLCVNKMWKHSRYFTIVMIETLIQWLCNPQLTSVDWRASRLVQSSSPTSLQPPSLWSCLSWNSVALCWRWSQIAIIYNLPPDYFGKGLDCLFICVETAAQVGVIMLKVQQQPRPGPRRQHHLTLEMLTCMHVFSHQF